jgi:hypothetical protein
MRIPSPYVVVYVKPDKWSGVCVCFKLLAKADNPIKVIDVAELIH